MKKLKTIFMGTPDFAIPSLSEVYKSTNLELIITKEDKINVRGNVIKNGPVKDFAIKNNIPFVQPKSIKDQKIIDIINEIKPDVIIVVAYGKIIPKAIIDIPKYIINVHSSILPKYRGASPIHSAIINGEKETGVSIMLIDEGLDSGDVLNIQKTSISEEDTLKTLHDRLSLLGRDALSKTLKDIENNTVKRQKQDDSLVTFANLIKKEDTKIDFSKTAREIFNLVRGLNPIPSAYTTLHGKVVKILSVTPSDEQFEGEFGQIVEINKKSIKIKVKHGSILLNEIKFEGKKTQTAQDIINGRQIQINDIFGKE